MRVLDLDLDFFLNNTCELAEPGKRPALSEAQPWPARQMRVFLEEQCGLSKTRPIPGAIFETHDRALDFWQAHASTPFHVTHVDAHSDLGIGKPGPAFVLESVITRPPRDRSAFSDYRELKKLDEANYLLFALAFRWVSSLDNVRNPASRPDMPVQFCHEGYIHLRSSVGALIPSLDHNEPRISFRVFDDYKTFRAESPYDLATLAISPRYSPAEADALADIFREYVTIE